MKKIILLALTALMMVGCSSNQNEIAKSVEKGDFVTIDYDSCEYLIRVCAYQGFIAHKGNCRFCEERDSIKWEKRKKELEKLVIKLKEK